MTDVDPARAGTSEEYLLLLRQRREVAGLSYRQLERRARKDGGSLPPSTVATMLRRSTLPGPDLIVAYVRACGGGAAEVADWLAARARLAAAAVVPAEPEPDRAGPGFAPFPARTGGMDRAARTARDAGGAGGTGGTGRAFVPPRQLPPAVAVLVGSGRAGAELDAVADRRGSGLAIVTGPPGSGKSAVAVHWAHRAAHRFPDGQLYVDLRGHRPGVGPLSTAEALTYLLVGLGVPAGAVPADEVQAAAVFRSLVADRKVLVLLDGAVCAEQIRLLRPGGPGTCTVVTSRDSLVGLAVRDAGRTVRIGPLDREASVQLLARAAGERTVAAEPEAARGLAARCEGLPLALRIAAAALDAGARAPIAGLLDRMRGEGRLGALELHSDGSAGLEAAFACSYRGLDAAQRRMFTLLGVLTETVGPDPAPAAPTVPVLAVAAGVPVTRARAVLRGLVDVHLLVRLPGDRYAVPGLLRDYALRLAQEEPATVPANVPAAVSGAVPGAVPHPVPGIVPGVVSGAPLHTRRALVPSRPTAGV
ncbi:helix-turn-helix domain-containing protein [Streptomyces qinzhouensis]|uniref:Helix-turn-helix domain-containing protein n=1 Tax=Streptomyces qinzhouensis TaxID=2599401 RepID=A0A5B8JGL1_9ACTN|nr:helix-turn-helix domain-containing protein [Streptomyces qinzhouensis]QDY79424.1 helix-turn-helix domain-containing protein [Streptomyces qinzhouensis]